MGVLPPLFAANSWFFRVRGGGWDFETEGAPVWGGPSVRAARTWNDYWKGELRTRFEISGTSYLYCNVRPGAAGHFEVGLARPQIEAMAGREHLL